MFPLNCISSFLLLGSGIFCIHVCIYRWWVSLENTKYRQALRRHTTKVPIYIYLGLKWVVAFAFIMHKSCKTMLFENSLSLLPTSPSDNLSEYYVSSFNCIGFHFVSSDLKLKFEVVWKWYNPLLTWFGMSSSAPIESPLSMKLQWFVFIPRICSPFFYPKNILQNISFYYLLSRVALTVHFWLFLFTKFFEGWKTFLLVKLISMKIKWFVCSSPYQLLLFVSLKIGADNIRLIF